MGLNETALCVIALDVVVTVLGWFRDRREHREYMAELRKREPHDFSRAHRSGR